MKVLFPILILFLLTSCAAKYGIVAGAQMPSYEEEATINDLMSGTSTTLPRFKNSGFGYHIGISEETDILLTKITYFANSYDKKSYTYESVTEDYSIEESGIEISTAFKLWWFQPLFGVKFYNSEYTGETNSNEGTYASFIFGLDFEVPISDRFYVYTGYHYEKGYKTNITTEVDYYHYNYVVGLRYNFSK
ncbi:hypothetical protein [Halobacteriovorax sp. RT-2-6]|uniref:hypothetical protein n=1 Tax=unclassified Halobacteriovorax TaxID=2639665 RepID=UPI003999BF5B